MPLQIHSVYSEGEQESVNDLWPTSFAPKMNVMKVVGGGNPDDAVGIKLLHTNNQ